jgi:hypothetical protein
MYHTFLTGGYELEQMSSGLLMVQQYIILLHNVRGAGLLMVLAIVDHACSASRLEDV